MLTSSPPTMTTPSGATGTMGADWSAVVDASQKAQEAEAGGAAKGDPKPADKSTETPPAAEPSAPPTGSDGAERRPDLPGDVLSVLLAATGPLAVDEIQRDVNATPGVFVPLQFIEAELHTLCGAGRVDFTTEGKTIRAALTPAARAEIDAPGLTIERRTGILVALARVTLGSASADFEHVDGEGAPLARLASGASLDEILGEMTEMGVAKGLTLPEAETHVGALCRSGVLVIETPLTDGADAGPTVDDGDDNDDNAFEEGADDEGEDEDAPAPVEASESPAKVYTFAMGQLDALWTVGARGLAERSMPTKETPAAETSIPASALAAVEAQLKTMAIKAAEFEEQRDKYKAENALLQLRWSRAAAWLDENGGGLDITVIAQEPAKKADPRVFQWEKRVSITTEIKARLLDELTRLDEQLAGICSAEEVAKGSFKEKKAKVAEQIAALKMASRGVEYLYTRKAYREPDFARGVVVVRSAEEHDYGTVLDEEAIPKGVQKPLFPTEPAAGPAPVKPATPGVVASAIGEATAPPAETGTASSAPAPATEPAVKREAPAVKPPGAEPAAAPSNASPNAGHIALADLALDAESVMSKIKQMHLVHPEGILERDQPVIFGQTYSPDRPMPGAVAAFVMKTIGLMLRDEEMVEADDDQGRGKLRWLATQTDPRRLTASMKERIKAKETEKAEKAAGSSTPPAGVVTETPPKRGRGRPPGAKNKQPRKDKGVKRGTKA